VSPTEHTAAAPPAALSAAQIDQAAQALEHARRHQAPIEPLTTTYPGLDVAGAYAIQRVGLRRRLDADGAVVGHKIGLTSAAMQRQLGVEEPDYGYLLADMILHDPGETPPWTSAAQFCQPRIEPEVAFRLAAPLGGPDITPGDVLAACDAIAPALEIVDSRIQDWRIALADTIADNASSAAVVLGPWVPFDQVTAPRELTAELIVNDEVVDRGRGDAVLGDPAHAVAWLATTLSGLEDAAALEPGQFVIPGSFTSAASIRAGDRVTGRFPGLGDVTVTLT